MAEMWLCRVVLEKESLPRVEINVLVSVATADGESDVAIKTALDTIVPYGFPVTGCKGKTLRELGYTATCYYKVQAAHPPLAVAWYY